MKTPHPDYGLTELTRRAVIATAELVGVRLAAAEHGVSRTSVYNWRRWYRSSGE